MKSARLYLLLVLLSGSVLWVGLDLDQYFDVHALIRYRAVVQTWVETHHLTAMLVFIMLYVVVVAFSLPVATLMTLAGGFLFGALAGGLYSVVGATLGSAILFLAARTVLGEWLAKRAGPGLARLRRGFERHALSYLLALRLVPLFPFFVVNLAPAFFGMKLRAYMLATFLGIMPATFVYALAGSGLDHLLAEPGGFRLETIMTPQMMVALVGMALLTLLSIVARRRGWLSWGSGS